MNGIIHMEHDFLRLVVPRFCVSEGLSVLGAVRTGYISAFWPPMLIVLTSLAMHLQKINSKIVVRMYILGISSTGHPTALFSDN